MAQLSDWYNVLLYSYIGVVGVLVFYGLHRYQLVYLYYKHRRNVPKLGACFRELPRVTVQLPMFNEQYVAQRIIEATCAIEYPRDKIEIQVLDDSTDETTEIARATVERMRRAGVSPSAGRSTCTFSTAFKPVTVLPSVPIVMSIERPATRRPLAPA